MNGRAMIPKNGVPIYPWRNRRLGWKPTVDLYEGIKATTAYFKDKLGL